MSLKISTWNINSVRLRLPLALSYLSEHQPDVLCLQETKCPDDVFPTRDFQRAGYGHFAIHGQKGYHGVALVSRLPLAAVSARKFCGIGDARHISAEIADGKGGRPLRLHNFYVPAGGDEPDPEINPKFAHKLAFLEEMQAWFADDPVTRDHSVLVGDLNIAPLEHDVWSHKALAKVVSHTEVEITALHKVQAAGAWVDALRANVPEDQKLYTWWSYRSPDWAMADRGRRLDHVWLSPSLAKRQVGTTILREARGWERPSDHVPVMVELTSA